jgi:hypothetical protein
MPVSEVREPCRSCGEETATGSAFYSDRRKVRAPSGTDAYICSACVARAAARRRGGRLTDDELQALVDNGSMAAVTWANGPSGP